jgi:hypothetical protein
MNREQIAYERGYRVTKEGHLLNPKGKIIGNLNDKGYQRTTLKLNKVHILHTHRLQAYQKFGNKLYEYGIMVRHLNGNKLDNSWDNIAIGTNKDNAMDIPEQKRKENTLKAVKTTIKYNKEFVLKLREEYKLVKNYNELSAKYNMRSSDIWYLINKRKVFKDA